VPQSVRHENDVHWYLKHRETGQILDPTANQFKTPVPYEKGRGRGFLTSEPSKRAQEVIGRVQAKLATQNGLTKAIQDIKPGRLTGAVDRRGVALKNYNYSHLLSPLFRKKFRLEVHEGSFSDPCAIPQDQTSSTLYARLFLRRGPGVNLDPHLMYGQVAGRLLGDGPKTLDIASSSLHSDHRGKGLGAAMYEALLAHAHHRHGVKEIGGDTHSTLAHGVHERLGQKHGFKVEGVRINESSQSGVSDGAFGPYSYRLAKAESNQAAFRHKQTGEVVSTGHVHDVQALEASPDYQSEDWEEGFVDQEGTWIEPPKDIKKSWPALAAAAMFAAAPVQADALRDAFGRASVPPVESIQPWSSEGLHPDLVAISQLESSGGKNVRHLKHPAGEYHTAFGAVGLKPVTAHETYRRSPHLQRQYGDLSEPTEFIKKFQRDPKFYNAVAGAHWAELVAKHQTPERAAFAWRHGTNAAATDTNLRNDPYVIKFKTLRPEPVKKAQEEDWELHDEDRNSSTAAAQDWGKDWRKVYNRAKGTLRNRLASGEDSPMPFLSMVNWWNNQYKDGNVLEQGSHEHALHTARLKVAQEVATELAKPPDWRPSESLPEDYYAKTESP
jgi:GNAT superfamily N-acetyltransferase